MTEKEKMLRGQLYNPYVAELTEGRKRARKLIRAFNALTEEEEEKRQAIIRQLFGRVGASFFIESPFICDYGFNIEWGENAYANFGCIILDAAPVKIGANVLLAPDVKIFTVNHPIDVKTRNTGLEYAKPITIGDNVWVGGGSILNPGVTIGENTVIGSGSVVTSDIPANVVAVGNPCRVNRIINQIV